MNRATNSEIASLEEQVRQKLSLNASKQNEGNSSLLKKLDDATYAVSADIQKYRNVRQDVEAQSKEDLAFEIDRLNTQIDLESKDR